MFVIWRRVLASTKFISLVSQGSANYSECVTKLSLKRYRSQVEVISFSQQPIVMVKGVTHCTFVSSWVNEPLFNVSNVIVFFKFTWLTPSDKLFDIVRDWSHLAPIDLNFVLSGSIDMLIGNYLYSFLLLPRHCSQSRTTFSYEQTFKLDCRWCLIRVIIIIFSFINNRNRQITVIILEGRRTVSW